MDSLPLSLLSSIFQHFEAKEICRLSRVNKKWNRTASSPMMDRRWKELFLKDFGEDFVKTKRLDVNDPYQGYYSYKSFIPNYIEGLKQESGLGWKEKYKRIFLSDEEDNTYKELMVNNGNHFSTCIAPKIYKEPDFNPILEYKKTKEISSLELHNPVNYLRAAKMMLFNPTWWNFFFLRRHPNETSSWSIDKYTRDNVDLMVRRRLSLLVLGLVLTFLILPILFLFFLSNLGMINTSLQFGHGNGVSWSWLTAFSFQSLLLFPTLWFCLQIDTSRTWPYFFFGYVAFGLAFTVCFWVNWVGSGSLKLALWNYLPVYFVCSIVFYETYRYRDWLVIKLFDTIGVVFGKIATFIENTFNSLTNNFHPYLKGFIGFILIMSSIITALTVFSLWRSAILLLGTVSSLAEAVVNTDTQIAFLNQKVRPPIVLFKGRLVITYALSRSFIPRISFVTYLARILLFVFSVLWDNSSNYFQSTVYFVLSISLILFSIVINILGYTTPY